MIELVNMANDYIEKCYGVPYGESIALQPVNHKDVYDAFIYAYEQGQNFQRGVFADNCKRCSNKRNKLEQENTELKELHESDKKSLGLILDKFNKENTELKAQIEKMKCCQNCYKGGTCLDYDCIRNNHKNWEFSK